MSILNVCTVPFCLWIAHEIYKPTLLSKLQGLLYQEWYCPYNITFFICIGMANGYF